METGGDTLEYINEQLKRMFGDDLTGRPIFRVVSSWDQYEKRYTNITLEGLEMIHPEIIELPKYDQRDLSYKDKYILERLVLVPAVNAQELVTQVQSYEPLYVYRDKHYNPLPPRLDVAKLVIDTMYAALGKRSMAKYVDEEAKNPIETREKRINEIMEYLYDDESFLLGRTITGEAVGYTGAPKIVDPSKS